MPNLSSFFPALNPGAPLFHNKGSHSMRVTYLACSCNDHSHITRFTMRDPVFSTIDHPLISSFFATVRMLPASDPVFG